MLPGIIDQKTKLLIGRDYRHRQLSRLYPCVSERWHNICLNGDSATRPVGSRPAFAFQDMSVNRPARQARYRYHELAFGA